MANSNPVSMQAYAAVLAASNAVVAKRAFRRFPPPDSLGPRFRVPALPDIPRLLAPTLEPAENHREHRVARVTAASLLYAHHKRAEGATRRSLHSQEIKVLDELEALCGEEARYRSAKQIVGSDTSCRYCRLFSRALYPDQIPDLVPVNQSAQVVSNFDPDRNIAEARIDGFQVLARKSTALSMIDAFHPLRWHEFAPNVFAQSDQIVGDRPPPRGKPWQVPNPTSDAERKRQIKAWKLSKSKVHYTFENVGLEINERMKSEIQNVLAIRDFVDQDVDPNRRKLSYAFSLESCLQSNFGLGTQYGGLDIDGGVYSGEALSWGELERTNFAAVEHLTERDLAHVCDLSGLDDGTTKRPQIRDLGNARPADSALIRETLQATRTELERAWREDVWLVTVTASKRLRYTAAEQTPVNLWALLTWLAPANLFVFINRAVCQPGHLQDLGQARPSMVRALAPTTPLRKPGWQ